MILKTINTFETTCVKTQMFWRQYANELFAFAYTVKKIIAYERTSIYNSTNWKYRLKNHAENIVNLDMYNVVKSLGVAINSVKD